MPAYDQQGIRGAHAFSITRGRAACPGGVRDPDTSPRRAQVWPHIRVNAAPARLFRLWASALPDPAQRWFCRLLRRQVLAVTPGAAGAVLVVAFTAWDADHVSILQYSQVAPASW
jgi:hypothetical protein